MATKKPALVVDTVDAPASIKLTAPHGFYDEAGDLQAWLQDEVVTDPKDVALLIERGAHYVKAD